MSVKTEGPHRDEFLLSQGAGSISFEQGTLKSGETPEAGRVLVDDGTGKLVVLADDVPSEVEVVGISRDNYDATGGDKQIAYVARLAEVRGSSVILHGVTGAGKAAADAAVTAALAKSFILIR